MSEYPVASTNKRNIWVRGLYMLLMACVYQLFGTLLFLIAVFQFVFALLNDTPNARLLSFGRTFGRYMQQIVCFLTFASEDVPFPFNDWPSAE